MRVGDREVFDELYREHAGAVFSAAMRLTGNRAVAEDVTSETFLVAWRTREALTVDDRPLRPWLLAVATGQAMNATRGVRRRLAFLSRRTSTDLVEDFADDTVQRLDDRHRLAQVRAAMGSLSRHEVEVVALCVWSELSYADAAEALGVPVATVRSRLARARSRLRHLTDAAARHPVPPLTHPAPEGTR